MYTEEIDWRPKKLVPSDLPGKFVVCVTPPRSLLPPPFEFIFGHERYMNIFAFRIPKESKYGYADDGFNVDCRCLNRWIRFSQGPVYGNENRYILTFKGTGWTFEGSVFGSTKEIIDMYFPYYNSRAVGEEMAAAVDLGFACRGWSA